MGIDTLKDVLKMSFQESGIKQKLEYFAFCPSLCRVIRNEVLFFYVFNVDKNHKFDIF